MAFMEPNFSRYIWRHTRLQQMWILFIVVVSMLPYYLSLDLPKYIVNGPIQGEGFETATATQVFGRLAIGDVTLFDGLALERLPTLIALSFAFLALVLINGGFKFYINTYKGLLGERLLRRIRFELVDRILRFQPRHFRHIRGGEISSMVKDEVEPLGGFTGDAFVQPALLGGQALTALAFIFVQNFWLGLVAFAMAAIQFAVIPPLRQRLIVLGRERQVTARKLAGRVSEIVEGINTIHAYDTSNYERADIATRLGVIFRIRYEIYQRKFMVKFLNNILAQLTPFLFYLIGGYFAIRQIIDVGQLVAVIAAYKELPGPLKELIDWDLTRQDVQVKYEQVAEQFHSEAMLHPSLQALDASGDIAIRHPLSATNLTLEDDGGTKTLEQVSLQVRPGETIAIVGDARSGADALAEALARLVPPASGEITAGEQDIQTLPEAITGRRISYTSSDGYFFLGTLRDNLVYGLKHAPQREIVYNGKAAAARRWQLDEAALSGNPAFDLNSDWIDLASANAVSAESGIFGAMVAVLDVVRLSDDVLEFALHSTIDAEKEPELARELLDLRSDLHHELARRNVSNLVVPFESGAYNAESPVLDNLLFGVISTTLDPARRAEGAAHLDAALARLGLIEPLYHMGLSIIETTLELFQDIPRNHPFFERLSYMKPQDIPKYRTLAQRLRGVRFSAVSRADAEEIVEIALQYIEPQHRFGVLDAALMQRIVDAREPVHRAIPAHLQAFFEVYDPARYLKSGTLIDNIVFGKLNLRQNDAERQVQEIITERLRLRPELFNRVFSVGLDFNIGAAGRKLTMVRRLKLNFARALIRRSDYYIFNRPLAGMDETLQDQIVTDTLAFLHRCAEGPAVVWVLANRTLAKHFARRLVFDDRMLIEDETNETWSGKSATLLPTASGM